MDMKINNKQENKVFQKFIAQNPMFKKKETNDVLNKPPVRYLAYSNEVGSAISPISKSLGTALWVPALLYLGADIYDKYKNEDNTYNPSAKRSVRQAIFQGFASVLLPSSAIHLGQKIGVRVATGKEALSAIDKKELVEFTREYLGTLSSDQVKDSFSDNLVTAFKEKANLNEIKLKNKNIWDKLGSIFQESKGYDNVMSRYIKADTGKREPIIQYLKAQGDTVSGLMTKKTPFQADKYIKHLRKANLKYKNEQYALQDTVAKLLKDKTINKSIVATISGFIALLLFVKPIDYFVEEVLMEKIVNPLFDKVLFKNKENNPIASKQVH